MGPAPTRSSSSTSFSSRPSPVVKRRESVGIFLSGGLDSVSIAAVAASRAHAAGEPDPLALSLAFPRSRRQRGACATRRCSGARPRTGAVPTGTMPWARRAVARVDRPERSRTSPLLNLWMPAYDRLAIAGRERGCVAILTGGGGDEWLTVSPYYAADLIRRLDLAGLARLYNEHRRSYNVSPFRYLRHIAWLYGLKPLALDASVSILQRRVPSALTRATLRRLEHKAPPWLAPDPALHGKMADRELWRREMQWAGRGPPQERGASIHVSTSQRYAQASSTRLSRWNSRSSTRRDAASTCTSSSLSGTPQLVDFLYRTPPELLNEGWTIESARQARRGHGVFRDSGSSAKGRLRRRVRAVSHRRRGQTRVVGAP